MYTVNMKKKDGMDFRQLLKAKPRNLPVHSCKSNSSPLCLFNFIQTREGQRMCENCIKFNELEEAHPFLDFGSKNVSVYFLDPED